MPYHRASRAPTLPTINSGRTLQSVHVPQHPANPVTAIRYKRYVTLGSPSLTPPSNTPVTPPSSVTLPDEGEQGGCDTCGRNENQGRKMRMMPCAVSFGADFSVESSLAYVIARSLFNMFLIIYIGSISHLWSFEMYDLSFTRHFV